MKIKKRELKVFEMIDRHESMNDQTQFFEGNCRIDSCSVVALQYALNLLRILLTVQKN